MAEKFSIAKIKKLIESKQVAVGKDETLKKLKQGKLFKIFLTSNLPDKEKERVAYYSKLAGVEIIQLSYPNDELGALCKKPFAISMLGMLK